MRQADNCMFEENKNEQLCDQVIDKCRSSELRRKLLEKSQDLTLEKVWLIVRSSEAAEIQAKKMESKTEVHMVIGKWLRKGRSSYSL